MKPEWQIDFDCTACGACCRAIDCVFLDDATNLCTVYEKRPNICRIGYSRPPEISVQKYIDLTKRACEMLKERVYGKK